MSSFSFVLVPSHDSLRLQCETATVLSDESTEDAIHQIIEDALGADTIRVSLLVRPTADRRPGLLAYSSSSRGKAPNLRATRLAMACGLFSLRFRGDVVLFRHFGTNLLVRDIEGAACHSPDLRRSVQQSTVPDWLAGASQQNYHDRAVLAKFASVMAATGDENSNESDETDEDDDDDEEEENLCPSDETTSRKEFVTKVPLCIACRKPSQELCPGCEGAYFCVSSDCRRNGWSHECLCCTWKMYTDRRDDLSAFGLGDWYRPLVSRDFQLSQEPYNRFLSQTLDISSNPHSWWRTETDGWEGGASSSALGVDMSQRQSFQQGFSPLQEIPPERRPTDKEFEGFQRDSLGLLTLQSWEDYYRLRGISVESPCALLLTFPLTIYHAIQAHGEVPLTVAKMLNREVRIHVIGIEKEINFLDLFKEVGFILPENVKVELVFVVREDMLPPQCKSDLQQFKLELTTNLTLLVVSGTYGEALDPNFDCGGGPPDMIIAMNAGLFAYESWRSVVTYLYQRTGVVGVFTDYNEHSGVNCASLGGTKARESLRVNPFRQPRAMPVYSMNLPQFSNGFIYVYNEQELE